MADIFEIADAGQHPVEIQRATGLTRIVLSSPPANALSMAMMDAILAALADAAADTDNRVVVIAGAGKIFSAGHDLKELTAHRSDADRGRAFFEATMRKCSEVMQAIVRHPVPVIAEVNGLATAAGCQLVASCDLAIASEEAQFCTPGVNIGLFCSTPMVAISRNMTRKQSLEMLLTGVPIDAETAAAFGLINKAVAAEDLDATVADMAATIVQKSARVIALGKQAYYRQLEMGLPEAYAFAGQVMASNMMMADATEGIDAFLEKRPPRWPEG